MYLKLQCGEACGIHQGWIFVSPFVGMTWKKDGGSNGFISSYKSNKNIYKMNVDVGISGEKSNGTRQGWEKAGKDKSEKYRKLLITFLHCHSKHRQCRNEWSVVFCTSLKYACNGPVSNFSRDPYIWSTRTSWYKTKSNATRVLPNWAPFCYAVMNKHKTISQ